MCKKCGGDGRFLCCSAIDAERVVWRLDWYADFVCDADGVRGGAWWWRLGMSSACYCCADSTTDSDTSILSNYVYPLSQNNIVHLAATSTADVTSTHPTLQPPPILTKYPAHQLTYTTLAPEPALPFNPHACILPNSPPCLIRRTFRSNPHHINQATTHVRTRRPSTTPRARCNGPAWLDINTDSVDDVLRML